MPCLHLRALIEELHPGVSVRQLSLAAGLPATRIAYYLKPSTQIDQMPPLSACKEIARALECDLDLVVEAFAKDVGYPWGPSVAEAEVVALIHRYRRMSSADRTTLLRISESLLGGKV